MSEVTAACWGRDVEQDGWPTVSVIVPVRNEGTHLARAVASILSQEYAEPFDVCLAVAPSDDDTLGVARRLALEHDRVSIVANPAGVTPAGLNAAVAATTGSIVVRVDGHAELSHGYVRRAVETMIRTGAVNVGGHQLPEPQGPFEAAVAAATTSRLGTGGPRYRVGGAEGAVDTVYLGVFDRAAGDSVGWFDEALIRNQDYELNIRLRQAGGVVWFDPGLSVSYRPRGTVAALASQYFQYGVWKAAVVRRHPDSLRIRQVVPVAAVAVLGTSTLAATRRPQWAVVPAGYLAVIGVATLADRRRVEAPLHLRVVATATMHVCWGAGAVVGGFREVRRTFRQHGYRA